MHSSSRFSRGVVAFLLTAFSLFYFADTLIRASEKYFWFDELCTLYICRLPDMHAVWQAVLHGADYNPPLFYVFTRAANAVFGEGLIATRLPAILGVWIFCLCLFQFVHRRAGILPAWIALLFPLLTNAYFYAYEARPHGIVLGFCGLALVFWQKWNDEPRRLWPLLAFGAALGGAFFTHCYAILIAAPFAFAEIEQIVKVRRIRWRFWTAITIPAVAAVLSFVPLLRSYKTAVAGTIFADLFQAGFYQLPGFYLGLLSPGIVVILVAFVLFGLRQGEPGNWFRKSEIILLVGFLILPVFGVLLGKIVHGPFIPRYFMSTAAGLAILLATGAGIRKSASVVLALLMTVGVAQGFAKLVWHWDHGTGEVLEEPSSKNLMNTTPGQPLAAYTLLQKTDSSSFPVVVVDPMEFFYLYQYDPSIRSRLYAVSWAKTELFYRLYKNVRQWCSVSYNREVTFDEFLPRNAHFWIFGNSGYAYELENLMKRGGEVESLQFGNGQFLAEISMKRH